jgi:hypothetical protein
MIEKIDSMKKPLAELATVLNAFKSEAVQLRILDYILDVPVVGDTPPEHSRKRARAAKSQTKSTVTTGGTNSTHSKKRGSPGTGATATLNQLLSGTFFDKPRTIGDIIDHCRHNLARTFKANEFSGKLGRLVRSNELARKKNADNQYEYRKL